MLFATMGANVDGRMFFERPFGACDPSGAIQRSVSCLYTPSLQGPNSTLAVKIKTTLVQIEIILFAYVLNVFFLSFGSCYNEAH